MRKITLTFAIIFATVVASFAQTSPSAVDNATLNVKLNPIQTLVVNAAQKNVDLEYKTVEHYQEGVSSLQEDHLKIYSTGAFAVTVESDADEIKRANGAQTIASSTIRVKAENGTTNALIGATLGKVSLSTAPTSLISSASGGVDKDFNITYEGIGANGYVNSYFNDENPTVYTTTVTYTISAQ